MEDSDQGIAIPELGQLVSVWGKVSEFRGEKQLAVTTMVEQRDPNAEPLHWLEVIHLKKTVYSRPFILPRGVLASAEVSSGGGEFPRHTLRSTVTMFLRNQCTSKHFTLKELAADAALLKVCKENRELAVWMEDELMGEMDSVVCELPAQGVVIPALGVGLQKMEIKYEVCHFDFSFVQEQLNTHM